jgi:Bacterial extracellular solute-binding protein, family 7
MSIARCAGLAVAVVVTLTVLPVLRGVPASAQITWNLPSAYPADNFHTQNLDVFARDLAQVTNGKLAIRVYPNASLLPAPAIKSAVRIGQVQIGEILISLHEQTGWASTICAIRRVLALYTRQDSPFRSPIWLISWLAKIPCGGHGTANSTISPWASKLRAIVGFDAAHNFRASS